MRLLSIVLFFVFLTCINEVVYSIPGEFQSNTRLEDDENDQVKTEIEEQTVFYSFEFPYYYFYGSELPYFSGDFDYDKAIFDKVRRKIQNQELTRTSQDTTGLLPDLVFWDDSKIVITGRKFVNMSYAYKVFPDLTYHETSSTMQKFQTTYKINQEMQVKVEGQIKNRFFINLDYDDTLEEKSRQKLTVLYKGQEDEILQTVEIGNINLNLPHTDFISFSKQLFGIRTFAKAGPFKNYMIISKEEGETGSASFTGSASIEKREILDLQYAKQFFSLKVGNPDIALPIKSIRVFVDNLNSSDNVNAINVTVGGNNYYFQELFNKTEFIYQEETGIIQLFNYSWQNGYMAVIVEDANGQIWGELQNEVMPFFIWNVYDKMLPYQMKNKYILGISAISPENQSNLKISIWKDNKDSFVKLDNNDIEFIKMFNISTDGHTVNPTAIDYDYGILTFPQNFPFDLTTYDEADLITELQGNDTRKELYSNKTIYYTSSDKRTKYKIIVENLVPQTVFQLNAFDIIENSERVVIDDKVLIRGSQYQIDYTSGLVTIIDKSLISATSDIKITCEYYPVFAAKSKSLFGTRLEYDYRDEEWLKLGVSYLSESMPDNNKDEIPRFGEEPFANTVYGTNVLLNLDNKIFPQLLIKTRGEYARSEINPNSYGTVIVDDMEGSELIRSLSMSRDRWFVTSMPAETSLSNENRYSLINVNAYEPDSNNPVNFFTNDVIRLDSIRSNFGTSSIMVLQFHKMPVNPSEFFAFGQILSNLPTDFSEYKYLEIWYRVNTASLVGKDIVIDLGTFSDDADGDGIHDTEDMNGDNQLSADEDSGYSFNISDANIVQMGNKNNSIDDENVSRTSWSSQNLFLLRYSLKLEKPSENNGWVIKRIPLSDFTGDLDAIENIKMLKIWGTGFTGGDMEIGKISIVGSVWDAENALITAGDSFTVTTIDNYSSPDFIPLHKDVDEDINAVKKDVAIELDFIMDSVSTPTDHSGFSRKEFGNNRDFTQYKTFRVYYFAKDNVIPNINPYALVVRFLTSDNDYYEVSTTIQPGTTGWKQFDINIDNLDLHKIGSPSMQSIQSMLIGVKDINGLPFRGILYVNDMLLTDVAILVGEAVLFETTASYNDLGLTYLISKRDGTYSQIGEIPRNIDTINQNMTFRINPGKLFFGRDISTAMNFAYSTNKSSNNNDIVTSSLESTGENVSNRFSFVSNFSINKLPTFTYSYNFSENNNFMSANPSKNVLYSHNISLNYAVPSIQYSIFTLTPSKLLFGFVENGYSTDYTDSTKNTSILKNQWNCDVTWNLINNASISKSIISNAQIMGKYTLAEQWDRISDKFTNQNESFSINGSYSSKINKFADLRTSYSSQSSVNWDLKRAELLQSYYLYTVNGSRSYSGGVNLNLFNIVSDINIITRSYDISFDYSNSTSLSYDSVNVKPDWLFYLGSYDNYRNMYQPKSSIVNDRYSVTNSFGLLKYITAKMQYGYSLSTTESSSGDYVTESRDWPNISITLSSWAGIPLLEYIQKKIISQSLSFTYKEQDTTKKSSTEMREHSYNPSLVWNVSWNNKIRSEVRGLYSFSRQEQLMTDTVQHKKIDTFVKVEYSTQLSKKFKTFLSENQKEVTALLSINGSVQYVVDKYDNSNALNTQRLDNKLFGTYNFSNEMKLNAGFAYSRYYTSSIISNNNEFKFEVGFEILF